MKAILSLGVVTVFFAGWALAGDEKGDLAKLQGTWTNELDGKKHEFKFAKDSFSFTFIEQGEKMVFKGKVKIEASKKPKQMDLTVKEGDKFQGDTALAIYQLDGDVLKWCACHPGQDERPTEFPQNEG